METKNKAAILINTAFYLFFSFVIYVILKYLAVYVLPFIISFVLVYALQKPSYFIELKFGIKKSITTLLCLILIAIILSSILFFAIKNTVNFFQEIGKTETLDKILILLEQFNTSIPPNFKNHFVDFEVIFTEVIKTTSTYLMGLAASFIKKLPGIVFSVITSLVSACFLAFEYDNFVSFIKRQMSNSTKVNIVKIKNILNECVLGFVKGYLILMLLTLLIMLVGLKLLGIDNALSISILISFVDLLPVFGTGIILLPWAVFSLITDNVLLGIGIIVLYVAYSIIRYFLEPKIIGKKVGVNPLISLVAMFLGLKLFGLLGLILAPISVSVLMVLQKNGAIKLWK